MRSVALFFVLVFFHGCSSPRTASREEAKHALPFIDDDYARALSEARTQQKPLFVEAWAPW